MSKMKMSHRFSPEPVILKKNVVLGLILLSVIWKWLAFSLNRMEKALQKFFFTTQNQFYPL